MMKKLTYSVAIVVCCIPLFSIANAIQAERILLSDTTLTRGEHLRVLWSGFSANVKVSVYRGNEFWLEATFDAPGAGYVDLDTSDWDLRSDYRIKIYSAPYDRLGKFSPYFSL